MLSILPSVNALLNTITAIFLVIGYAFIRQKRVEAHKICMLTATLTSTLFLASYLYYHYFHGATRFKGTGVIRSVYFTILISHTILAMLQLPLILTTLYYAFGGNIEKHRRFAQITLPIWMYVSVTGVVIYYLLYQYNPH